MAAHTRPRCEPVKPERRRGSASCTRKRQAATATALLARCKHETVARASKATAASRSATHTRAICCLQTEAANVLLAGCKHGAQARVSEPRRRGVAPRARESVRAICGLQTATVSVLLAGHKHETKARASEATAARRSVKHTKAIPRLHTVTAGVTHARATCCNTRRPQAAWPAGCKHETKARRERSAACTLQLQACGQRAASIRRKHERATPQHCKA